MFFYIVAVMVDVHNELLYIVSRVLLPLIFQSSVCYRSGKLEAASSDRSSLRLVRSTTCKFPSRERDAVYTAMLVTTILSNRATDRFVPNPMEPSRG